MEFHVLAQLKALRHVLAIGQNLRLGRVALAPLPLLLQRLIKLVGIFEGLHIAAGAGVAIPVPGAANIAPGLEDLRSEALLPSAMEHVHPPESRPYDDEIKLLCCVRHVVSSPGSRCSPNIDDDRWPSPWLRSPKPQGFEPGPGAGERARGCGRDRPGRRDRCPSAACPGRPAAECR